MKWKWEKWRQTLLLVVCDTETKIFHHEGHDDDDVDYDDRVEGDRDHQDQKVLFAWYWALIIEPCLRRLLQVKSHEMFKYQDRSVLVLEKSAMKSKGKIEPEELWSHLSLGDSLIHLFVSQE